MPRNPTFDETTTNSITDGQGNSISDFASIGPTPSGTTVADIATAADNNTYVRLKRGATYTHDGTSFIDHNAGDGRLWVDARGATIQVRGNPVVDIDETSLNADNVYWFGGWFEGSGSAGEVAFDLSDSVHNYIWPQRISDCEVGVAMFNEDLWCEYNSVRFQGESNECTVAQIGYDGSPPSGSSLRTPVQNGGTDSFRRSYLQIDASPAHRGNLTTAYGVYHSDCNFYGTSVLDTTMNLNTDIVGWRIHGNLNGSRIYWHSETAGTRTDGTAFVVDRMDRPPFEFKARVGQAGGTTYIVNNASIPLITMDNALTDGGSLYGPRKLRDGSPITRHVDGQGGNPRTEYVNGHVHDWDGGGSAAAPAIRLNNADGLFTTGSGLAAVNGGGDSMTYLRPFSTRPNTPVSTVGYLDDGTGTNAAGWWLTTDGGTNWTQL